MKLKVLELFAGIGACSKALKNLGIPHEIVDAVEIDKFAIKSFNAIHSTNFEPQDITKWDKNVDVDLIMHGSPCQDFSLAGKQAGGDKDSGTRSSLMYETLRIVEKLKPKYVIWENVKNLISKKHIHNFEAYQEAMRELGYVNYYQVLNAKDYGVPQNRERIFTISIRDDHKGSILERLVDICFEFPKPFSLEHTLKDFIDDVVDKKYYIDKRQVKMISEWNCYEKPLENIKGLDDIIGTITTRSGASCGGMKLIRVQANNKTGYDLATYGDALDLSYPSSKTRRGRVGHGVVHNLVTQNVQHVIDRDMNIRKLTPLECWRLMGFDDSDFKLAKEAGVSDCQLYKQAGNSIVVNVIQSILKEIFYV